MYLTSSNQYNGQDLADSVSIMDIARMKGYRTYWIGNHSRSATGNTPVSVIAQRAQQVYWTKNAPEYDENIMPFLKQIPGEGANFIVIHIMGSHVQYTNRVPEDFAYQGKSEGGENGEDYDRTVAYTDQILHEIFDYARQNMNLQVMVYAPDHGEDMRYGHGTSRFLFDMVRIPLWMYLSPEYMASYPETADRLKQHENVYFTNDLMFDTVSGLIGGQSNYYSSRYDLSSPDYSLPLEEARTLHGRRAVSEDPALHS
jgi:heptose-I-phosphate ethanolaminephosphotransferase